VDATKRRRPTAEWADVACEETATPCSPAEAAWILSLPHSAIHQVTAVELDDARTAGAWLTGHRDGYRPRRWQQSRGFRHAGWVWQRGMNGNCGPLVACNVTGADGSDSARTGCQRWLGRDGFADRSPLDKVPTRSTAMAPSTVDSSPRIRDRQENLSRRSSVRSFTLASFS